MLLWKKDEVAQKKLKVGLPYDPEIQLLGLYLERLKSGSQRDICKPMLTAALFTIIKL